ncbi:MAG TPA: hypothetical protein VE525_02225 [Rubrobacter sp.]|nr:hypothetical protein [Rubrobacter sp.]
MSKLEMGMVGGGGDALIGAVHRSAALMDGEIELVAGALSSSKEKALASGRDWELSDDRNYGSWQEMLESELALSEEERIDFVSVVTPVPEGYSLSLIASSRMLMDSNTDSRFSSEIAFRTRVNL